MRLLPLFEWQLSQQLGYRSPWAHRILSPLQGRIRVLSVLPGLRTALEFIYPRLLQTWLQKTGNRALSWLIMIPVVTMPQRYCGSKAHISIQGCVGTSLAIRKRRFSSCDNPNKTLEAHLFLLLCFTGPTKVNNYFSLWRSSIGPDSLSSSWTSSPFLVWSRPVFQNCSMKCLINQDWLKRSQSLPGKKESKRQARIPKSIYREGASLDSESEFQHKSKKHFPTSD